MEDLKVGDVVVLKSGSDKMTITEIHHDGTIDTVGFKLTLGGYTDLFKF